MKVYASMLFCVGGEMPSGMEVKPCVLPSDQESIQLKDASDPDEWQRMQVPMDWAPSPTFTVRFC